MRRAGGEREEGVPVWEPLAPCVCVDMVVVVVVVDLDLINQSASQSYVEHRGSVSK